MKYILLLLALPHLLQAATKSDELANYMGTRYLREAPTGAVTLIYANSKPLHRQGDGAKTWDVVLTSIPGYNNADAGELLSVQVKQADGTTVVVPRSPSTPVAVANMQPLSPAGETWALPDSASMDKDILQMKKRVSFYQSKVWMMVKPWWGFFMYLFWAIFPLIGVAGCILWFWAKLSANEEMPGIHYTSSRWLLLLVGATWTIFFLNIFMTIVYWELSAPGFCVCMAISIFLAYQSAAWIIPNFRIKLGGRTVAAMASSAPQLNQGKL